MKLLLDQGLPRSSALLLRNDGWDVVHVGELNAASANDRTILKIALETSRVVVTLDADFHALLAASGVTQPSVVRIRTEGLKAPQVKEIVLEVLHHCEEDLRCGALITVQKSRIRVRRLPLAT